MDRELRLIALVLFAAACGSRTGLHSLDGDASELDGTLPTDATVDDAGDLDDRAVLDASNDGVLGCGLETCAQGCCGTDGMCHTLGPNKDSDEFCGYYGEPCEKCDVDAGFRGCKSHTCLRFDKPCSPADCPGCCFGSLCASGVHDNACGSNGQLCSLCAPKNGERCTALPDGGGTCKAAVCSPTTCAGCCLGNVCAVGTQDFACGTGGAACQNCVEWGKFCKAGQCAK